jgi:PAS domain S-box-containing protein
MADNAPVMIRVTDSDGSCTYLSKRWREFTGQTPEKGLGSGWLEAAHPEDRPDAERAFTAATKRREAFRHEYRLRRHDGAYRWVIDSAAPRFGPGGEFQGHVGSVMDLTDRKESEERLRESEQQLRRASRLKDEFLATLSHELRTPLNAVLGWSQMLRTGNLRGDVAERALGALERNARAQAQLVNDLLDMSRIVSGKLQVKSELVDLGKVVTGALDTMRPAAAAKGVSVRMRTGRGKLQVIGDADRLRQIVWNLLANAIKFTPSGGRVDVELGKVRSGAEIVVRDSGEGIEKEFLPFVFDRFAQADGSTTRRHGGLGLGLAIVRYLTEAHGGTVTAFSEGAGTGATFTIHLPTATPRRPFRTARRSPPRVAPLQGAAILVVDDEADARELLRVVLETEGAQVTAAESAGEALQALARADFDVLLADIGMPDRDGLELIRTLRTSASPNARVPAIAVTAYAGPRERQLAFEAGYQWHVSKPVDPAHLAATVADSLRDAAATRDSRSAPREVPRSASGGAQKGRSRRPAAARRKR